MDNKQVTPIVIFLYIFVCYQNCLGWVRYIKLQLSLGLMKQTTTHENCTSCDSPQKGVLTEIYEPELECLEILC